MDNDHDIEVETWASDLESEVRATYRDTAGQLRAASRVSYGLGLFLVIVGVALAGAATMLLTASDSDWSPSWPK